MEPSATRMRMRSWGSSRKSTRWRPLDRAPQAAPRRPDHRHSHRQSRHAHHRRRNTRGNTGMTHTLSAKEQALAKIFSDEYVFTIPSYQRPYSRSEEHTSELQSLMRISYAVFCLKKKKRQ